MSTLLPLLLPVLVAIIGLSLPALLHDDSLPGWANGLIALAIVLCCSVLMVQVGGKLTGNSGEDIGLYTVIASALLVGPLKPLVEDLQKVPMLKVLLDFLAPKKEPPHG